MSKILVFSLIIILIIPLTNTANTQILENNNKNQLIKHNNLISYRKNNEEVIIIPESDPFFGIIGASLACWYETSNISILKPLIIHNNEKLTDNQILFLDKYLTKQNEKILILGNHLNITYPKVELLGDVIEVAMSAARYAFFESSTVMIIPYGNEVNYQLSLIASPIASYLNIPVLIYNENENEIQEICDDLNVSNGIIIGDISLNLTGINITKLENEHEIQDTILIIIKNKFGKINYITMTNPSDVILPSVINTSNIEFTDHIKNTKIIINGKKIDLKGEGEKNYVINISDGINKIEISSNIGESRISFFEKSEYIIPIINLNFYDDKDNIIAYSSSLGYKSKETFIETLACNAPGNYKLNINIYNGIKGGFFTQRGFSITNTDFNISIKISELEKPHITQIKNLSMIAPYLAGSHGGIIIADSNFGLSSEGYIEIANGSSTGPWYNLKLHNFTNSKVNYSIEKLKETLNLMKSRELLQSYINGPAWLAILADTNMIPMYYYGPSQEGIYEKGLPSDNPYSLNWNLSVGRIMSYDIQDVSLLITNTLFYEKICGEPTEKRDWHNRFSFIFGEGFGETGGIFHQIPYSFEIRKYGFQPQIYGDIKNGRLITTILEAYTGSNYIEYLGHGDWYWYTPSLYGLDMYSKAIDVAHAKDWVFDNPSIFLTSACLMGRTDGIPTKMNIGLTMIHAGCNCFLGATRLTGSEAGLEIFENHLIVDDYSIGEALRGEKRVDKEIPTYYVRVLYGDPAFNPYEPNNGFSNQGRPHYD